MRHNITTRPDRDFFISKKGVDICHNIFSGYFFTNCEKSFAMPPSSRAEKKCVSSCPFFIFIYKQVNKLLSPVSVEREMKCYNCLSRGSRSLHPWIILPLNIKSYFCQKLFLSPRLVKAFSACLLFMSKGVAVGFWLANSERLKALKAFKIFISTLRSSALHLS